MSKWAVFFSAGEENKCHYLNSKEDARIVFYWYLGKRIKNVKLIEVVQIEDLDLLRHMAMGEMPVRSLLKKK